MGKKKRLLKEKLTNAVKKVLIAYNVSLISEITKAVEKSINQIVSKTKKEIKTSKKPVVAIT